MTPRKKPGQKEAAPQCLILAGGLATRLRGHLPGLPKSLAPVAGKPFLEHVLLGLAAQGLTDFVLCTGYQGDQIEQAFGDGVRLGLRIRYSRETEPLGTAGAVKNAEGLITSDPFVVMNGDTFTGVNIGQLLRFHQERGASATLALVEVEEAGRFGAVETGDEGKVLSFAEKSAAGPGLINSGTYVFGAKVVDSIAAGPRSLEREVFPALIGNGLYGMCGQGFFLDLGTPESLQALQNDPAEFLRAVYGETGA